MDPTTMPALISLVISVLVFPSYIRWLKSKQIEQTIRQEGPQSHAAKSKTPTMGGLCFILVGALVAGVFILAVRPPAMVGGQIDYAQTWENYHRILDVHAWPAARLPALSVLIVGVACAFVGLADDYRKVSSKSNKGISARARLLVEFLLGLTLSALLYVLHAAPTVLIGFGDLIQLNGSGQAIYLLALVPFLVAATTNAINLHDGMDGLAGGTSVLVFSVLFFMTLMLGQVYLALICAAMVGAITGFLVYNHYPAKVFMGDTGSLFIGGVMAAVVAAGGLVLWFIPLALLYIAETVSVIAQVVYFKLTKEYTPPSPMSRPAIVFTKLTRRLPGEGKRLFRMAPLHHHFEAVGAERGEPEWKVVAYFWVTQFMLCAAIWLAFHYAFPGA